MRLALLLALAALLALFAAHPSTPSTTAVPALAPELVDPDPRTGRTTLSDRADPATSRQERVAAMPTRVSPAEPTHFVIRGCCLDSDLDPVPGVEVGLRRTVHEFEDPPHSRRVLLAWRPPPRVRTDQDGRYEFRIAIPDEEFDLAVVLSHPHATTEAVTFSPYDALDDEFNEPFELEDIQVEPGYSVRGTIMDHRGQPVRHEVLTLGDHWTEVLDGEFAFDSLPVDDYFPELLLGTGPVLSPGVVSVGPDADSTQLEMVVSALPRITGMVLDTAGQPLAGGTIEVEFSGGGTTSITTDATGRFRTTAPDFGVTHALLRPEGERWIATPRGWVEFPSRGLVLREAPRPPLRIRIVSSDGRPARVAALEIRDSSRGPIRVNGIAEIPMPQLPCEIRARTPPPKIEKSDWTTYDVTDLAKEELVLHLSSTEPLHVTVSGHNSDQRVEVSLAVGDREIDTAEGLRRVQLAAPHDLAGTRLSIVDAENYVEQVDLTAEHCRSRRVAVRLSKPTFGAPSSTDYYSVELPGRRCLVTSVWNALELRHVATAGAYAGIRTGCGTDYLRSSASVGSTAGVHELRLEIDTEVWTPERGRHRVRRPPRVLGFVHLDDTPNKSHILPATGLQPGRLCASLPPRFAGARIEIRSVCGLWFNRETVGPNGRFESWGLPAGEYRARLVEHPVPGVTGERELWLEPRFRISGETRVALRMAQRTTRFRALDAGGEPLRNTRLALEGFGMFRTDDRGFATLTAVPPGPLRFRALDAPGRPVRRGRIDSPRRTGVETVRFR